MSRTVTSFVIVAVFAAAATGSARMAADAAPRQPVETPKAPAATMNPAKEHGPTPNAPALDPHATHALEQMNRFLRNQKNFTVRTTTHTDRLLDNGQMVKQDAQGEIQVERPNKVRANIVSDRQERQVYFDGHTFTIYNPTLGTFATTTEQGSIEELAEALHRRYQIELPLVELFRVGVDPDVLKELTAAKYVGPATIDGVATDQFAFRQPGLDWQIWIQQGDKPLPRKLVLTTTDIPSRPEHAVEMTWSLGGRHHASAFYFVPPKGSHKVAMAQMSPQNQGDQARRTKRSTRTHRTF